MKFEDRSIVHGLIQQSDGAGGINLHWTFRAPQQMETVGFIVCYRSSATHQDCRDALAKFSDEELMEQVRQGRQLTPMESGADMLMCATGSHGSFHMMGSYFCAPCIIEIWAVLYHSASGQLFVCDHVDQDSSCCRKLELQMRMERRQLRHARTSFGKIVEQAEYATVLCVAKPDASARYVTGAAEYLVRGQNYAYPIAEQAIGCELVFPGIAMENILVHINAEYEDLYALRQF